jgi:hypothetical protein
MAGFADSVSDDLLMIGSDDPRTGTYYRRTAADTFAAGVTITGVLREDKSDGMLNAAGAVLPQGSTAFHAQASQVGERPWPGDVWADQDGQRFSIDSVNVLGESTWYRVVGVPEV